MTSEQLQAAPETFAIFDNDSQLAGHHVSPLHELRERSHHQHETSGSKDFELLPDGSGLLQAQAAYRGLLHLKPGDGFGILISLPEGAKTPELRLGVAQQLEQVGIVLAHEALLDGSMRTHLLTARRVDGAHNQVRWNNRADAYDKKADAAGALTRYFSDEGSELTQITGALFLPTPQQETTINEIGHQSHHTPIASFGTNMLARIPGVQFRQAHLDHGSPHPDLHVRVGVDPSGERITPLTIASSDNQRILGITLASTAVMLSHTNPSNMGRGTSPQRVFDAMQQAVSRLPEHMGNGATLGQAHQSFARSMR